MSPQLNTDEQNELEFEGISAQLKAAEETTLQPTVSRVRSGSHEIKVTGDPYSMFAKGPKDIK